MFILLFILSFITPAETPPVTPTMYVVGGDTLVNTGTYVYMKENPSDTLFILK